MEIKIGDSIRINKPHLANNPYHQRGGHGMTGFVKEIGTGTMPYVIGHKGMNEMHVCTIDQLIKL